MPSALLLDEPLAALDLKLREAMQLELKRIQREVGITFIFVTHDQGEALTMSDRIAVMSRGRVEQIGTPEEIYGRPSSIFVAGFIGSANLLPGRLEGAGSGSPTVVLDSGIRIAVPASGDAFEGDPVTVMLRPERLTAVNGEAPDGRSFNGSIRDVIFQGSEIRLLVDLPDGTEVVAKVESDDDLPPLVPGDTDHVGLGTGRAVPAARTFGRRRGHHHRRRRGAGGARRHGARRRRRRRRTPQHRPSARIQPPHAPHRRRHRGRRRGRCGRAVERRW